MIEAYVMAAATLYRNVANSDLVNTHRTFVYNIFIVVYMKFYQEYTKDTS